MTERDNLEELIAFRAPAGTSQGLRELADLNESNVSRELRRLVRTALEEQVEKV